MRTTLIFSALVALSASTAWAGDRGCCEECGSCLRPVCRVVCEMEKVKETVYDCECEDFCVPGRSKHCGCQDIPTCKHVRTRKKLVKTEKVTEKPKYKCVVEYVCANCAHAGCDEAHVGDARELESPLDEQAPMTADFASQHNEQSAVQVPSSTRVRAVKRSTQTSMNLSR